MAARTAGLQVERTTIAWTRTALSFAANGLLLVPRLLHQPARPVVVVLLVVALGLALVTAALARWRRQDLRSASDPAPVATAALTAIAGGIGILGLLLVLDVVTSS